MVHICPIAEENMLILVMFLSLKLVNDSTRELLLSFCAQKLSEKLLRAAS